MTFESTILVLDTHRAFMESTEFQGAEIDVPETIVDFFEADILSDADSGDINPMMVPANAAVGADITNLEAIRILERWNLFGHGAWRRLIDGVRSLLVESFMRANVVKF